MPNNELLYPIFLDCCKLIDNTFWKYIFEDLAYGISPYGTYITKDFLCCNYKNKEFSYKIDNSKESKEIYDDIKSLFVNKLGLLSQEDRTSYRNIFNNLNETENNETWQSIKKKGIKSILIENYVISCKNKYTLTITQTKSLLSSIILGTIFKTITNDDIEYCKGKIKNIKCLKFANKKFYVTKNLYDCDSIPISNLQNLLEKKKLSDLWNKYLLSLFKI
jgi:hypothetical protein